MSSCGVTDISTCDPKGFGSNTQVIVTALTTKECPLINFLFELPHIACVTCCLDNRHSEHTRTECGTASLVSVLDVIPSALSQSIKTVLGQPHLPVPEGSVETPTRQLVSVILPDWLYQFINHSDHFCKWNLNVISAQYR
ncbi:hypothetical protein STEG23_002578 [Scotinomys teguina]